MILIMDQWTWLCVLPWDGRTELGGYRRPSNSGGDRRRGPMASCSYYLPLMRPRILFLTSIFLIIIYKIIMLLLFAQSMNIPIHPQVQEKGTEYSEYLRGNRTRPLSAVTGQTKPWGELPSCFSTFFIFNQILYFLFYYFWVCIVWLSPIPTIIF